MAQNLPLQATTPPLSPVLTICCGLLSTSPALVSFEKLSFERNFHFLTLYHKHSITNTQPQTPNHKHPTANTPPQTPHPKHPTANTQPQTPNHKHPTANTQPQTPNHKHSTTNTPAQTPTHKHPTTNTPLQTPHHKHPTTNTPPQTPIPIPTDVHCPLLNNSTTVNYTTSSNDTIRASTTNLTCHQGHYFDDVTKTKVKEVTCLNSALWSFDPSLEDCSRGFLNSFSTTHHHSLSFLFPPNFFLISNFVFSTSLTSLPLKNHFFTSLSIFPPFHSYPLSSHRHHQQQPDHQHPRHYLQVPGDGQLPGGLQIHRPIHQPSPGVS